MKFSLPTFALFVGVLTVVVVQSQKKQWNFKVIRGKTTKPGKYPWFVLLKSWETISIWSRCGASLIDDDLVLTAAHCICNTSEIMHSNDKNGINGTYINCTELVVPLESVTLTAGIWRVGEIPEATHQVRHVKDVFYEPTGLDLAIIKTTEKFNIGERVERIGLRRRSPGNNEEVYTCGFGVWGLELNGSELQFFFPTKLQDIRLFVLTDVACSPLASLCGNNSCFCTFASRNPSAYKNICVGDSGGPVHARDRSGQWGLFGVVSHMVIEDDRLDPFHCLHPSGYSVSVDVTKNPAYSWIWKTITTNWKQNWSKEQKKEQDAIKL